MDTNQETDIVVDGSSAEGLCCGVGRSREGDQSDILREAAFDQWDPDLFQRHICRRERRNNLHTGARPEILGERGDLYRSALLRVYGMHLEDVGRVFFLTYTVLRR